MMVETMVAMKVDKMVGQMVGLTVLLMGAKSAENLAEQWAGWKVDR